MIAKNHYHVAAHRRHRVQPSRFVAIAGDVPAIDLEHCRLSGREVVEAVRLLLEPALDEVGGDLGIAFDELAGARERLHPGGVEQIEPGIVLLLDHVGEMPAARRSTPPQPPEDPDATRSRLRGYHATS